MKTTKTYLSGCTWCNARGFVINPISGIVADATITCPVCQGAKTILVTETIEDEEDDVNLYLLTGYELEKAIKSRK
jgi:hypothetical protein